MKRLLSKIFSINQIQVVGVYQDANFENYEVLSLMKDNNKLTVLKKEVTNDKNRLITLIDVKKPVVLLLNGKSVLNKKIDFSNESDLAWQKNIDYNSIFHTSYKAEKALFVSFCRKNVLEDWLIFFQENKIQVIDFYLGNFATSILKEQLNQSNIFSNSTELIFNENELVDFLKNEVVPITDYLIGEEKLNSFSLPTYASGINFFIKSDRITKSVLDIANIEEQLYKKAFNVIGIIILIGFFISLLISYFGIQYYASKNAELNIQNIYSNKAFQEIVDLENQKKDKEAIIKDVGLLSNKFLTYYDYELLQSIPNEILLNNININPIKNEVKNNKKIELSAGLIEIEGLTVDEVAFNNWLKRIKEFDWVQKFEIESLKKDKKNNTQFSILIKIK
ncbi:MAG: hypothetical protein KYX68_08140 [Flavobacterium sp.]|nr:hypothetical protein [Flavobacterium sp.]